MFGLLFNMFISAFKVGTILFFVDLVFFNMIGRVTYDDLENFATTIGWKLLRLYSKIHIFSNNYIIIPFKYHILTPTVNIIKSNMNCINKKDRIIFVKDGNEILKFKSKDEISSKNVTEYDFILFYPDNDGALVLDNINNIPFNNANFSKYQSICGFMCCQITVTLKNDNVVKKTFEIEDFCMNSNKILDEAFVKWYCNKNFPNEINIVEIKTYKINIIDDDVNEIVLTPEDFIIISKLSYKIHNKKQKTSTITNEVDHNNVVNDAVNDAVNDVVNDVVNSKVNVNIVMDAEKKDSSDEDIEKIESLEEESYRKESNNSSLFSWFYKNDLETTKKKA